MSTPSTALKTPTRLGDFDQQAFIRHPSLPDKRQFVVQNPDHGRGIWSDTLNKAILPIDPVQNHLNFEGIKPSMPTSRIFWIGENNAHRKTLYMAESETECAHEVKIPQAHKFGSLLSGNIVLLTCDQMTDPHRHKLWSIDTKGMQPLEVRCQGFLETVHVLENGNQIILAFRANDGNRGPTSAGIFIIDSTKFTVERVPSTP